MLFTNMTLTVTCSSEHVRSSLSSNAGCHLQTVVVMLSWPNSTMVQQMTQTHVSVQRCGGGCHGMGQGCTVLSTHQKEVSVMVSKCGVSVGKCEKECVVVSVEEHTECGCGCQVERGECEASGLHRFREELCTYECRDTGIKQECLEQGRTWTVDSCSCDCPASPGLCPNSWTWEEESCSCQLLQQEQEARVTSWTPEESMTWELVHRS